MAMKYGVITLTGSTQALNGSTALNVGDEGFQFLSLQPDGGNANAVYVGGDSSVSATAYGVRLEAATAGVPPAPWQTPDVLDHRSTRAQRLSEVFVRGTNTEKLRVMWVPA